MTDNELIKALRVIEKVFRVRVFNAKDWSKILRFSAEGQKAVLVTYFLKNLIEVYDTTSQLKGKVKNPSRHYERYFKHLHYIKQVIDYLTV